MTIEDLKAITHKDIMKMQNEINQKRILRLKIEEKNNGLSKYWKNVLENIDITKIYGPEKLKNPDTEWNKKARQKQEERRNKIKDWYKKHKGELKWMKLKLKKQS